MPAKVPVELRPLFAAMMEIMEVGEGVRGDKLDRKITMRDLLDGGLASLRVQGNPDAGLAAPSGPQNMAIPPRPIGFAADGSFFGMIHLSWEVPQAQYNNHSITNIYRNEEDNFATAEVVGREPGMFYSDRVRDDALAEGGEIDLKGYYYWITYTSDSNIQGPPNSPDGTFAEPLPDTAYLLGQLSGQLGESELSNSLQNRIDKIDGPRDLEGSVAQRLSKEAEARIQAITKESNTRLQSIEDERAARIAAIASGLGSAKSYADAKVTQEQQARADGLEAIATQIEQLEVGLGEDYTVGMIVERQARIDGDKALASNLSALTAYAEGTAADVVSEQQARASADEALASDISALYVESGDLAAGITNESLARIAGDKSLSAVQQVISAANSMASAAHKVSSQVFIDENSAMAIQTEELRVETEQARALIHEDMLVLAGVDEAQAQRIDLVEVELGETKASVTDVSTALVDAERAIAESIGAVQAEVDDAKSSIKTVSTALVDAEQALAKDINTVNAKADGNQAAVQSALTALADAEQAIAENISTVQAGVDDNKSTIQSVSTALTDAKQAIAEDISTVQAGVDESLAAVQAEATARSAADTALAEQINTVQAGVDVVIGESLADLEERLEIADTRNDNKPPSWYWLSHPKRIVTEIKNPVAIGLDVAAETQVIIETMTPGADSAAGPIVQTAIVGDGQKNAQRRNQGTDNWTEWQFHSERLSASVQQLSQVVADIDGTVSAQYTLKTDVNGYVAGFGSYNDGTTADFAVLADRFWVAQPGRRGSAIKPFMVVNGITYMNTAIIRDGSIQEGKLGPITFGKLFDSAGRPITTLGGKLRADMIDVNSLRVYNANIAGTLQSSSNNSAGRPRWIMYKTGGLEINGSNARGRMELRDTYQKFFDSAERLRVQIGDLGA